MLEETPNTVTPRFENSNVSSGAVADDRAPRGGSFQSLSAAALVPFKDRCAYIDIPELALRGQPPVSATEVWDDFSEDFASVQDFFHCIQKVRPNRLRIWCASAQVLEDVMNTGLTLRGHPLHIKPVVDRCWLTVTHLPYGLSKTAIEEFFAEFGEVKSVRFEVFRQVHTGTIKVNMVLHKSVPTRIRVLGHAGLVYHPGQARTCFHCGAIGHESQRCPKKEPAPTTNKKQSSSRPFPPVPAPPSGDANTPAAPGSPATTTMKRNRSPTSKVPTTSCPKPGPPTNDATSGQSQQIDPPAEVVQNPPLDTAVPGKPPGEAPIQADPPSNPAVATLIDIDGAATTMAAPPQREPTADKLMEATSVPLSTTEPTLTEEEVPANLEVSSPPKGSSGPPIPAATAASVELEPDIPLVEEPRFKEPPLVRSTLKAVRKKPERNHPLQFH